MPISRIKDVGPKAFEAFKRIGITNVLDLLFHRPSSVIDRRNMPKLATVMKDQVITQIAEVASISKSFSKKAPYKVRCANDSGVLDLVFFGGKEHITSKLVVGAEVVVSGTVSNVGDVVEMIHPDIITTVANINEVQILEPVYPTTYGISSKYIAKILKRVLSLVPNMPEWIPNDNMAQLELLSWRDALIIMHSPKSELDILTNAPAIRRLAFDEILAQQLSLLRFRAERQKQPKEPLQFNSELKQKLISLLPFELTEDQQIVIKEIEQDQASDLVMMRLLQGDVGSGKTLVALIAMLNVYESGHKAALMVPTELLALQHYNNIKSFAEQLDLKVELLIANQKQSVKDKVLSALNEEGPLLIIGTHSLFQDKVFYKDLKLVIVDEQHRFGVEQRNKLLNKNASADFLMMTATPIPRTMSMANNGDLDVSIIKAKPKMRKAIKTIMINESKIADVIEGLGRVVERGEQVYWICPLIDKSETLDLAHVNLRYETLKQIFGEQVIIVHGQLSFVEREKAMDTFKNGIAKIMVATSVIEVGVDVPNATVMVIENAERFGLAQLHQIRGRVGRGNLESNCVLLYGHKTSKIGYQRLTALRESNDGFYISEQDLKIRGSGEILGTRQSGIGHFRFFDIFNHEDLLYAANKIAKSQLRSDSKLHNSDLLLQLFESNTTQCT